MVAPRPLQHPRPPIWVGGNSRAALRRAVRHADGWIPWMITPADFALAVVDARAVEAAAVRATPIEYVAPVAVGSEDSPASIRAQIEAWCAAGATSCHVGFAHRSLEHLLDRMAAFAAVTHLPSAEAGPPP